MNVITADQTAVPGTLLDVSADGVGVEFSGPGCPTLEIGQEVKISFTSKTQTQLMAVRAKVSHRTEEQSSRRYGFAFTNPEHLNAQIFSSDLFKVFNRRGMCRVNPDPDNPVEVTLGSGEGQAVRARLRDISGSGIGVLVPAAADRALAATIRIDVRIELPGCPPVNTEGIILHRTLTKTDKMNLIFGIELDFEQVDDPQQDVIIDYVMKRQQEVWRRHSTAA